jgi:hypothetical protein
MCAELKCATENCPRSSRASRPQISGLHHPLGIAFWESGKGLKAHDWFVIPITTKEHRDYHGLGVETWERTYGQHKTLLKVFWASIGVAPGEWMTEGMEPKRAPWLRRVLQRLHD